ncbi:recombination directionality factor [Streptomyces tamarix]|uniref:recombination directionality factor n=1 Tax=Streptomyces tamarix TaxID=3078565 RepID=UPI0037044F59
MTHLLQSSGSDLESPEETPDFPGVSGSRPVGRFSVAGRQGGRPIAVSAWRVTTEDRAVAEALGELLGDVPQLLETGDEHVLEVQTRCDRFHILLEDSGAVSFRMVMRGSRGTLHICDGTRFLEPSRARGSLCGCPAGLADRKAAAQAGRGPMPEALIRFRLADLPELGVFCLVSSSWELAAELPEVAAALEVAATPALGVLRYELVGFTTRSGIAVSFRRPVVEVGRALDQDSVQLAA